MGESRTGAKAGAVAGFISLGIVESVTAPIAFRLPFLSLIGIMAPLLMEGIVLGVIFGVLFSFVKDKFMTNLSLPLRGLIFGLAPFALFMVLNLGVFIASEMFLNLDLLIRAASIIIQELGVNLLFGYLIGYFFARFGGVGLPHVQ
ncbi:MAG: hypothetical protein M1368_05425 [Thaumarchaeota archaeon]|nr:hypothetical protein [Nitrososphaerota archaeon]